MYRIHILISLFLLGVSSSCSDDKEDRIHRVMTEWEGRTIRFPSACHFTISISDTVGMPLEEAQYKILSYVDSTGCISCKLQLGLWRNLMEQFDSLFGDKVAVLLFLHPTSIKDIRPVLLRSNFDYPLCIDLKDSLNCLNKFSSEFMFQTFLLDKDNKVLAIGNPVLNPKVKDLYLRIIRGESPQAPSDAGTPVTTVSVSSTEADLGTFPWQEPRTCTFTLRNTGDRPLVIHDVTTSCGCLMVDYPEEPARPGEELTLRAHYRADSRGTVLKSMQVYCNAQGAPLRLRVTGTAE